MLSGLTWSREGVTLGENSHLTINTTQSSSTILTSQLVITNAEQADTGNYSCSVSSETGMDVKSFFLLVTGEGIINIAACCIDSFAVRRIPTCARLEHNIWS